MKLQGKERELIEKACREILPVARELSGGNQGARKLVYRIYFGDMNSFGRMEMEERLVDMRLRIEGMTGLRLPKSVDGSFWERHSGQVDRALARMPKGRKDR